MLFLSDNAVSRIFFSKVPTFKECLKVIFDLEFQGALFYTINPESDQLLKKWRSFLLSKNTNITVKNSKSSTVTKNIIINELLIINILYSIMHCS